MSEKDIILKIKRQKSAADRPYWETFRVAYRKSLNVIACLMDIQRTRVNADGKETTPVTWECNCLEGVCGACSMVINGTARQACEALVDKLKQPIILEPLSKFPVVRDLMVDRKSMFDNLMRARAWIDIDGTHDIGAGPRITQEAREWAYELSRCMTCGCCVEACPQVNPRTNFVGAHVIAQVQRLNAHPIGEISANERLRALMEPDGIGNCANSQNCQRACPRELPLVKAISEVNKEITIKSIFGSLKK